jgi:hypothetical protein
MRDPRTLGPYQAQRLPSPLDYLDEQSAPPAAAAAMAQAAAPPPTLASRIAGLAGSAASAIGQLPPFNILGALNNGLQAGNQQRTLATEHMRLANEQAMRQAQLEQAQLPAQQALAQAQAREQGAITDRLSSEQDPRTREGLIHGAATGNFQPFDLEPTDLEKLTYSTVLGITQDQAAAAVRQRNAKELADQEGRLRLGQIAATGYQQRLTDQADNAGKLKITQAGKAPGVEDEKAMRSEFESLPQVKNFGEVQQAYRIIRDIPATKAGDLTLLVKYMKLIDPSSSVREGELATADKAGGVPAWLVAQYNQLRSSGGRLEKTIRDDYVARANGLYQSYLGTHHQLEDQYRQIATRRGFDPRNVVTDFVGPDDGPKPEPGGDINALLEKYK